MAAFLGKPPLTGLNRVTLERPLSAYLAGRKLGEEQAYILNRKQQKVTIGNMLPRPSLLLNPYVRDKSDTSIQEAKVAFFILLLFSLC